LIMDLQMPVMSGLDAAKAIRERENGKAKHLPIIAATAHALRGDKERCFAAGIDGYVAKPIQKRELEAEMNRLLQGSSQATVRTDNVQATLDEQELLSRVDGDFSLLGELAEMFSEDYPRQLEMLGAALEQGSAESIRRAGHTLKGMLANLAAPQARNLAAQ